MERLLFWLVVLLGSLGILFNILAYLYPNVILLLRVGSVLLGIAIICLLLFIRRKW